jgi:hypothetical protein
VVHEAAEPALPGFGGAFAIPGGVFAVEKGARNFGPLGARAIAPGRPDHFRAVVARYRPRPAPETYLRLRTLPGEQAQVDWGHFGTHQVGRARRPLMGFVMVLSYSRQIFLHFFYGSPMANFLRGHVAAFATFGGVARILLYDNLRSAVLERRAEAIRFHPTLLELAGHYRFRAASGGGGAREREGTGGESHSLHPRPLLRRPLVHRPRRSQPSGPPVVPDHCGHSVRFLTASELLHDLAAQESTAALSRRLRRYVRPALLVCDEVGYLSYDARYADLLFEVVTRRYQSRKSIVLTTNKPFAEWPTVFPNAACVVTLVDRLIHRAEIITIEGESYRLKEARERAANKARSTKSRSKR